MFTVDVTGCSFIPTLKSTPNYDERLVFFFFFFSRSRSCRTHARIVLIKTYIIITLVYILTNSVCVFFSVGVGRSSEKHNTLLARLITL